MPGIPGQEKKLRLGGIFHAARALWAMGVTYDLAYIAPGYLTGQINAYAKSTGAATITKIGDIVGSPSVILIGEPKEAGYQGYDLLLRDEYSCTLDIQALVQVMADRTLTDVVIFVGSYDVGDLLDACRSHTAQFHIDVINGKFDTTQLQKRGIPFETIFVSTSSDLFHEKHKCSIEALCNDLLRYTNHLVFKENRGGARLFQLPATGSPICVGAQLRPVVHSVGVGDCFDVAYVARYHQQGVELALHYAAWVSSEYAVTTYPDDFRRGVQQALALQPETILELPGICLPWEQRKKSQIYIAAPDFDFVDTHPIEAIVGCLQYHNFSPRRPVKENGQMEANASPTQRQKLFNADMALLDACDMVLAVLLNNDPGTLIEIGLAYAWGKPVVVYDPYHQAQNLMLTQLPDLLSSDLDEIIAATFTILSRKYSNA